MSSRENGQIENELMPRPTSMRAIETNLDADGQAAEPIERGQAFSLPEADGGRDAWLFLAGCFMVEAMVWGASLSINIIASKV